VLGSYSQRIAIFCIAYLLLQWACIPFITLGIDDFWLGYHTFGYQSALPYRDFSPYKTVLGYYLFLVPMKYIHHTPDAIFYTKAWIGLINTFFLVITSFWLKKFYSPKAILTTLALIVSTQMFLSYSSDIRVDLLAYWFCLISVIFILEENFTLAGICVAIGFLVCQKAVWYVIATNCGLAGYWLLNERSWKTVKHIFIFNFSVVCLVTAYILFWAHYASLKIVLLNLFYEPYIIMSDNWYISARASLWSFIVKNNPGFILLWPFALMGLIYLPVRKRIFIGIYASVIIFFIALCKQPFDYYPMAAIPALFILYAAFFTSLYNQPSLFDLGMANKKSIAIASLVYLAGLILLYFYLDFPSAYLMAGLIPMLICASLTHDADANIRRIFTQIIFYIGFLMGVFFPIIRFICNSVEMDYRYQQSMVRLLTNLLSDGGAYIAGVPLVYNIPQPIPGLVHLVGPSIEYMAKPSEKLYSLVSLSSMYLAPTSVPEVIQSIENAPVKLYVDNNRFHLLSKRLHRYLDTQYQHYWGSIFLYAPEIQPGHHEIRIKFAGNYKVNADSAITLDKIKWQPDSIIHLAEKIYISDAKTMYRLELIPNHVGHLLDPKFKDNNWEEMIR